MSPEPCPCASPYYIPWSVYSQVPQSVTESLLLTVSHERSGGDAEVSTYDTACSSINQPVNMLESAAGDK